MQSWENELKRRQRLVEAFLQGQFTQKNSYQVLLEAMRYSLLAGGKRLRPVLCMSFCEACGGVPEAALRAGAAIEMVHTYSLIHDDLPCMDNDDFRRGKPTCHKAYGEDVATLAGDALLTAAFRFLVNMEAPAERIIRCIDILSCAAGEHGMIAGQILDLEGEKRPLSEEELRNVHWHKTGEMIRAACQMGVVLGGGTEQQIEAAGEFAHGLGIAFQIRDDILDYIGTQEELGKPIGSDAENGKSTFVTLFGIEKCQKTVESETAYAVAAIKKAEFHQTGFLEWLAQLLMFRRK